MCACVSVCVCVCVCVCVSVLYWIGLDKKPQVCLSNMQLSYYISIQFVYANMQFVYKKKVNKRPTICLSICRSVYHCTVLRQRVLNQLMLKQAEHLEDCRKEFSLEKKTAE